MFKSQWNLWEEIKYRITMTGYLLAIVGVVFLALLFILPIILAFLIVTIGGFKFLVYILTL